jgi:hypothetical protein
MLKNRFMALSAMSERLRRLLDRAVELSKSQSLQEAAVLAGVIVAAVIFAGVVYALFSGVTLGVAFVGNVIRVFYPDQRAQTIAEFLVTATFYLLGFAGLLLYTQAFSKRFAGRSARYMLAFSTLLIAVAALGLIGGYISKSP